jgi:hypothetical protein
VRRRFGSLALAVTLLALQLAPAAATEITTDLWVYNYGDTVTVTGVDYAPLEQVELVTTDPYGVEVDRGQATADESGGFTYQFTLLSEVPGIYDVVGTGLTSGLTAYTQFDPPNINFTFPAATAYNAAGWDAGCSTAGGDACGTAGSSGQQNLTSITGSLRQGAGNYWNGTTFGSASEFFFTLFTGSSTNVNWTFPISSAAFPADGSYTLHIRAVQTGSNGTQDASRTFTIDKTAPTSTIDAPTIGASTIDASGSAADGGGSGLASLFVELYTGTCAAPGVLLDSDTDSSLPGGSWQVNNLSGGATPGTYCIRSTATDGAGNVQSPLTNREYTVDTAPSVASTVPANGAVGVAVNSNVTINFDEPVTVDQTNPYWIDVSCATSGTHTGTTSGGGGTWTFDPGTDFSSSELCTVTVRFNRVHDVDTNDPPDEMNQPHYVFTFTTAQDNTAPEVDAGGPYNGVEGSPIGLDGTATDDDGDSLTYEWSVAYDGNIDVGGSCQFADEFALDTTITCDDDSSGATFTLTLTVNGDLGGPVADTSTLTVANVDPEGTADNASVTVDEGDTGTNTGTYSDDGANDSVALSASVGSVIDEGSGAWSWSFGTSDGPEEGQTVTIYGNDSDGTGAVAITSFALQVDNVEPTIEISGATNVDEGSLYSLNLGTITDPGNDTVTSWRVHWGDGNTETFAAGGAQTHAYADGPNTYNITADLLDEDSTPTYYLDQANALSVQVDNVKPTVTIDSLTGTGGAACIGGNTVTLGFSWTDPAGAYDTYDYDVDWGDGTSHLTGNNATSPISGLTHSYPAGGPFTIVVTVNDEDPGAGGTASSSAFSFLYNTSGVLQPINLTGPRSSFKLGSTIPVKIRVTDCDGVAVSGLTLTVHLKRTDPTAESVNELVSSSAADTGTTMRYTGAPDNQYMFNLSTKRSQFNAGQDLTAGTYQLCITAPEIANVVAYLDIKK